MKRVKSEGLKGEQIEINPIGLPPGEYVTVQPTFERFNEWDENLIKINYNKKLNKLNEDIRKFRNSINKQLIILAAGGHDCAVEVFDPVDLYLILEEHIICDEVLCQISEAYWSLVAVNDILDETLAVDNETNGKQIEEMIKEYE